MHTFEMSFLRPPRPLTHTYSPSVLRLKDETIIPLQRKYTKCPSKQGGSLESRTEIHILKIYGRQYAYAAVLPFREIHTGAKTTFYPDISRIWSLNNVNIKKPRDLKIVNFVRNEALKL